jgi:hypothetical protein
MHMNYGKNITGRGKRIMRKRSSKQMQRVINQKSGYGLALWNTDKLVSGKNLVGHTGSAYGLYSIMFFDPKKKHGIVVITNGCKPVFTGRTNETLRSTYNVLYDAFLR